MKKRDAKIILVVGGRGTGKTFFLEKHLNKDNTIIIEYIKTPRWAGHRKIFFKDLINGKVNEKDLCNSTVVFEDATSYISSNMSNYLRRLIVNSKQLGSDVFLVFHSINIIPPFLWYLVNNIVMFNCAKPRETPTNSDYFAEIMRKWEKLQRAKPYSYEEIETQI